MTAVEWRTELSDDDQRRVRGLIDVAGERDGIAPVGDQVLRELGHDRTKHLLAVDDGALVGYLNLAPASGDAPAMAEAVVHPDRRRRGIGKEMVRVGLAEGGDGVRIWAHGDLDGARATAAALGLTAARELLQMWRPLTDLPPSGAPEGVRVTTYSGRGDDAELLRVNNAAFAWHPEQSGWTEAEIAERRTEAWFDPAGLFLAFDESTEKLLGFHWTKVHNTEPGMGEVYVIAVDPAAQGRGIGAALTLTGLHHLGKQLSASSRPTVILYVEADNSAAVNTYRRLGFEVYNTDVAYTPDVPR